jgi:F-box/leucine-rich repeat protein 2/20
MLLIQQNCRQSGKPVLFILFSYCSCVRIGDDGLAALATGCKKLTMLNLSYCNRMTDTGLKCISNLSELSDLELRGISNITSIGIKAVAINCKRLAHLDLKHCEKINDSGFWALAFYSQNLLQVSEKVVVALLLTRYGHYIIFV